MSTDANDFLIFAAIARCGSLTAAARELALPKSTVSRRLLVLEKELGGRLLNRTTRKAVLTEFGQHIYDRAVRIEESVAEAKAFAEASVREPEGVLRISTPADFVNFWLANALAEFTLAHPRLRIEIHCSPRRVDLVGERYDVALRMGKLDPSSLIARHLLSIPRRLFASPGLLAGRRQIRRPEDLSEHRFVLLEAQSRDGHVHLRRRGRRRSVAVSGAIVSDSLGTLVTLGISGAGIVLVAEEMAEAEVVAGRLVPVLPEWAAEPMEVHYLMPAKKLLPEKARLFVEHLVRFYARERRR